MTRLVATTMLCLSGNAFAAAHLQLLYSFHGPDGSNPEARLIADAKGNLFGTASSGGAYDDGCVFELSLDSENIWTETVLYSFSGPDGQVPLSSLIWDRAGNLYGTTVAGGAYGLGTVYELSPSAGGTWTEKVLYSFGTLGDTDGWEPESELIFDAAGNLYSTTQLGGVYSRTDDNGGTVFQLTPGDDGWTETQLYSFAGEYEGPDGDLPGSGVAMDKAGNLYGTTQAGGSGTLGALYELSAQAGGTYSEKVILSFDGTNGNRPNATPVVRSSGVASTAERLYGTTALGGSSDCGVVFALSEGSPGVWSESILHQFAVTDGCTAHGPVAFDAAGNLYVTAQTGGGSNDGGVYELVPKARAPWEERILTEFDGADGNSPLAGVIVNGAGDLFGTTSSGGAVNKGAVYGIMP